MRLGNARPLGSDATLDWELATGAKIRAEIVKTMDSSTRETVEVAVILRSQNPPFEVQSSGGQRRRKLQRHRRLQGELELTFDVQSFIRTNASDTVALSTSITGAFDSVEDQLDYVDDLRSSTTPELGDVVFLGIMVPIPTMIIRERPATATIAIIAGLVVVGVCAIALTAFFIYTRKRNSRKRRRKKNDRPVTHVAGGPGHDYASEIVIDMHQDEVTTLGDPIPAGLHTGPAAGTGVSVADSVSLGYDFQKFRAGTTQDSLGDSHEGSNPNIVVAKDDESLGASYFANNQFDVAAPPGLLGLVLETASDGVPTVHAIKPTSPLASQVRVGDRLLSVDGEDVTVMLASDVSRLIAAKKDNGIRRFIFARPGFKYPGGGQP